jgi:hypothetical protein
MINENHISEFSQKLNLILESELEQGNLISETSVGWPKSKSIFIILEKPFFKEYQLQNITFKKIDDRHYWKAEYRDEVLEHILACRF